MHVERMLNVPRKSGSGFQETVEFDMTDGGG